MKYGNFNKGLGKELCSFVLAGTMVANMVFVQVQTNEDGMINTFNELEQGYYYDEDVKKNREEIMMMIAEGGSLKTKTYGKKREIVPKTITR